MLKKRYLIIFIILLSSSLISLAFFNYIDSSTRNYIRIGEMPKDRKNGLNGAIFRYDRSEKINLAPEEWINRASFTSFGKLFYLKYSSLPVNLSKISYFDKVTFASDYVLALYTKDIESKGTVFDISSLVIDVINDTGMDVYAYDSLKVLKKGFRYSTTSKMIKETADPRVSCAVIDLSTILTKYNKSKMLWINVLTSQGNVVVKIRG